MTPTSGLHACPGSYITERVFGYTPDRLVPRLKRKGPPRQTIYNPARRHYICHFKLHSQFDWLNSSSIPSNRLSSLQSCWEYFAANSTWPYTKLTGISFPSGPTGPTSAMWLGSAFVYRVFTMAQASLAPWRQADIFHNQKRRRTPFSFSASSPRPSSLGRDGHKAWATPCIACRTRSCSCESSGRRSPVEPGISSAGRPVSIPTDITLLFDFPAELPLQSSLKHLLYMLRRSR